MNTFNEDTSKILKNLSKKISPEIATAIFKPELIPFMTNRLIDTTDREGNEITVIKPLPRRKIRLKADAGEFDTPKFKFKIKKQKAK